MLIIALPHHAQAAAAGYAHVHSDGQAVLRHASGAASTLSMHTGEVVGVLPHSRLSWLAVSVPPGSQGPRLQAVLNGLLEDRLLEDPDQLHIVPEPDHARIAQAGGQMLVAVCQKQWLHEVLMPLQAAGITVQRLVPEISPEEPPVLFVMGHPDHSQCVMRHALGVVTLPPNTAQWSAFGQIMPSDFDIRSEPAMVERVQHLLQRQPQLQNAAQRWVQAAQSDWDLARGEWAQGRSQQIKRFLQASWQALRHAPEWRWARWGLVSFLFVQVIGLNVLAWREQTALRAEQETLKRVLTQTFPSVTLVVDAPLQMQREVEALKQKTGAPSRTDFEPMLAALASVLPSEGSAGMPTQLHYANQALRIHGVRFDSAQANVRLQTKGYQLRDEGNDVWVLQAGAKP